MMLRRIRDARGSILAVTRLASEPSCIKSRHASIHTVEVRARGTVVGCVKSQGADCFSDIPAEDRSHRTVYRKQKTHFFLP